MKNEKTKSTQSIYHDPDSMIPIATISLEV